MKPQFKPEEIYLDLSKLSEEQRKYVGEVTNTDKIQKFFKPFPYLFFDNRFSSWNQCTHHDSDLLNDKTGLTYSQFLDMMGEREEVLQVENKISIKEITELCNEYNRSDLKISNLKRDLEYKKSWNEESFAIQEIKQQISILQKIKETAQSKLQEIGIVF